LFAICETYRLLFLFVSLGLRVSNFYFVCFAGIESEMEFDGVVSICFSCLFAAAIVGQNLTYGSKQINGRRFFATQKISKSEINLPIQSWVHSHHETAALRSTTINDLVKNPLVEETLEGTSISKLEGTSVHN
jgi:hypothetical protein